MSLIAWGIYSGGVQMQGPIRPYRLLLSCRTRCHVGHVSLALPPLLYPSFLTLDASYQLNRDDF
jgi:hypothetical protein